MWGSLLVHMGFSGFLPLVMVMVMVMVILVTPPDPKERGGPAQTPYIVVLANEVQRSNT